MTVDPPALSIAEIVGIFTILSGLVTALIWLIKNVREIRHETSPNSGTSMNDKVAQMQRELDKHTGDERDAQGRIERQLIGLRNDVQEVHGRITEHMQWHMDHTQGRNRTRHDDRED